jgi:hypothetical protein
MAEKKTQTRIQAKRKKAPLFKLTEEKPSRRNKALSPRDILNFSSAIITILGAALLFMLGWAYESNWYGYFGVNAAQVIIQPQDVIIQSIPGVVTIVSCLSAAVISYSFFYFLYQFIKEFRKRREVSEFPARILKRYTVPILGYSTKDWIVILLLTEIYLAVVLYFLYLPQLAQKFTYPNGIWTIYELNYLPFLATVVFLVSFLSAFLFFVIILLTIIIFTTYLRVRSWFGSKRKAIIDNPSDVKMPRPYLVLALMVFLIILTSVALSAVYGVNDASNGTHTGAWQIQEVIVVSPASNLIQQLGGSHCYTNYCESRTFGLIGENDKAYILIAWDKIDNKFFRYSPGIILLPRSDNVILIPYNYGE